MAAYLGLPSDFGLNVKPTPYFRPAGIKLILKNIAKSLLYWNRLDPSSALARKHLLGILWVDMRCSIQLSPI